GCTLAKSRYIVFFEREGEVDVREGKREAGRPPAGRRRRTLVSRWTHHHQGIRRDHRGQGRGDRELGAAGLWLAASRPPQSGRVVLRSLGRVDVLDRWRDNGCA